MRTLWGWRLLAAVAVAVTGFTVAPAPAGAVTTWSRGDVFVGVGNGSYNVFDPNTGALKDTISDGLGGITTGCTFNNDQTKLYTTNWERDKLEVYDVASHALVQTLSAPGSHNESIVFADDGTFYVSRPLDQLGIDHYSAAGVKLATLASHVRTDWMDLSTDQRTMFFTDEDAVIHRWNVATDTRLPDFATTPTGGAFAIRLLPPGDGSGGLLVAAAANVLRYDGAGNLVQTYNNPNSPEHLWFSLTVGLDEASFWAASTTTNNTGGRLYHFDLASGRILLGPITAGSIADGICVKGALSGSAFGLQVRSLLVNVGPTPFVSQTGPGSQSATLPTISVPGVATISGLTASTQVGPGFTVTSTADAVSVDLVAGTVVASGVHATCTADASGTSGSTAIGQLTVLGQTLSNITPNPNTAITIPLVGQLVLNEQVQPERGSITVNALHLRLIGGTDVIVDQASCEAER